MKTEFWIQFFAEKVRLEFHFSDFRQMSSPNCDNERIGNEKNVREFDFDYVQKFLFMFASVRSCPILPGLDQMSRFLAQGTCSKKIAENRK